jgi:hypothetical protein
MKTIKKHFKSIAAILSMLILVQGCTVYKSTGVTLEQAMKEENKVKVETTSGEKLKFKRIGFNNDSYYGVKKQKGEIIKTHLDPNFINNIKEKDKTLSTVLSIGIPLIIVGGLITIAASSSFSFIGPIAPHGFIF